MDWSLFFVTLGIGLCAIAGLVSITVSLSWITSTVYTYFHQVRGWSVDAAALAVIVVIFLMFLLTVAILLGLGVAGK